MYSRTEDRIRTTDQEISNPQWFRSYATKSYKLEMGNAARKDGIARHMARKYVRRALVSLIAVIAALALIIGYLLVRSEVLERRFRQIQPDDSEARLLDDVGAPTSVRGCGEGVYRLPTDGGAGARRCARVYWYSVYMFTDGWLVPIDDTGHIMQIRRLALP